MTVAGMSVESIQAEIQAAIPEARVQIVPNPSPSAQHSLLLDPGHALAVARHLRDTSELRLDYCSNVSGVDWLTREISEKVKISKLLEGIEQEVEEVKKTTVPGYLEVVYHLFSMEKKYGPVILRLRTEDRASRVHLPSLTPVWRSAEFQEREVFDLYGVIFDGHPDLRRILMWEGFLDHPMRKDYIQPDDYEYEPTPHDRVLERVSSNRKQPQTEPPSA